MKLKKSNWLVKWAFWPDIIPWLNKPEEITKGIPENTDLCTILSNALMRSPTMVVVLIIGVVALSTFLVIASPFWLASKIFDPKTRGIVKAKLTDWKDKTCTKVTIE